MELAPGRWYEVGATEYGGPGDPTSGDYGSIPNPGESYLPAHPDSFAELSVLDSNPANTGGFTFADANALSNLPYLTGLRVAHDGRDSLLLKRDTRLRARTRPVHRKRPALPPGRVVAGRPAAWDHQERGRRCSSRRAPGAAPTLGALPASSEAGGAGEAGAACPAVEGAGSIPLPLTPGTQTKILPSGLAAAGEEAPAAVKRMVAAGNRLFDAGYLYGGAHGTLAEHAAAGYDCSSAVSYVLHAGGVFGEYAEDSTELESYGEPGPGRYVSIYANAAHAFMYVGGLRFDTVEEPAYDTGPELRQARPEVARLGLGPQLVDLDRPPPTAAYEQAQHQSS